MININKPTANIDIWIETCLQQCYETYNELGIEIENSQYEVIERHGLYELTLLKFNVVILTQKCYRNIYMFETKDGLIFTTYIKNLNETFALPQIIRHYTRTITSYIKNIK